MTPGDAATLPRSHLRTFGTLQLIGPGDDTILGDHGHQRRRLALLAVLASAGELGRSRDQLQGVFWPDVPQDRARHSLQQLMYAIRTSLNGDVFSGVNPVRLNSEFIGSDVADFADALKKGDLETAVELYSGPFLDGFYLSDAPEFEQWTSVERARIERLYIEALEALAKKAEKSGDFATAARWRQELVETDPLSGNHAMGLIRALMNAGDHVAALRHAERYEAIVAQEFGTSVGPAVVALVAEVRERAKTESVVVRGVAPPGRQRDSGSSIPLRPDDTTVESNRVPGGSSPAPRKRWTSALYGVAALALVGGAFYALRNSRAGNGTAPLVAEASIAVLPLANLSGDPRDVALADGLSEELIGVLARIDRLRVVARTSAFVFKSTTLDVRQIADSLRVANILEGGIQRIGERLRVQVRLINARDGSTRWSETYDRDLQDVFIVQSDIAGEVARELNLRIGKSAAAALRRRPTQSIAAYELYLRGNDRALLRNDSTALVGLDYFRQAAELDSTYSGAYAGLARMYLRLRLSDYPGTSARERQVLAREAALKAVALDDSLAEAHAAVGMLRLTEFDFAGAEKALKRAVALDPEHSRIREWLAFLYYWQDRPADALAETSRAVDLDPLSPTANAEFARALCANGKVEEGLAHLKSLESVRPALPRVKSYKAICHGKQGDWAAAVDALPGGLIVTDPLRGHALAHAGRREEANAIIARLTERWRRTNDGSFLIAVVYAGLGDLDRAFEWLNRSVGEATIHTQLLQPLFDDLRGDPRYQEFRRRVGLQK